MKLQLLLISACLAIAACAPPQQVQIDPNSKAVRGAGLGALAGATAGVLTAKGDRTDKLQRGAIGAVAGAAVGGGIGAYLDRQEAQLRQSVQGTGVTVQRQQNSITLNLPGDVTFATNSSAIAPRFYGTLDQVAGVLAQYPDSRVLVTGHTDNVGSFQANQTLSEQRARSVGQYLSGRGVGFQRISTVGRSFTQPIANNSTPQGRQQNRRVDITISPNA